MNLAEKLAAAYLRLNGFFLLPHFTVFSGTQHNHVDLIAIRCPNSKECVGGMCFRVDDKFFEALSVLRKEENANASFIGIVAEVKTNDQEFVHTSEHLEYVKSFFGDVKIISRLGFSDIDRDIVSNGDRLDIGMRYAGGWIQTRIDSMDEQCRLTKLGSWTWSESFLSDLLVLRKYGFFNAAPPVSATNRHGVR